MKLAKKMGQGRSSWNPRGSWLRRPWPSLGLPYRGSEFARCLRSTLCLMLIGLATGAVCHADARGEARSVGESTRRTTAPGWIAASNSVLSAPPSVAISTQAQSVLPAADLQAKQGAKPSLSAAKSGKPEQKSFESQSGVAFEVYNLKRQVAFTQPSTIIFNASSSNLAKVIPNSAARVTRFTVTETMGWKVNEDWTLGVEIPYARASFSGLLGSLERPPTLAFGGGNLAAAVVDESGRHSTTPGFSGTIAGFDVTATPGRAVHADIELDSLKDLSLHPHWQVTDPTKGKHSLSVDFNIRLPTGQSRLTPDEQVLVSALGEASLDVNEPYFGKGLDLGFRANWTNKPSPKKEWNFSLGYTKTGEYEQTLWPQSDLELFFNQGVPELLASAATQLGASVSTVAPVRARMRTITSRDPADQISAGAAFTVRPSSRRRDQYAISAVKFVGENARNVAGIVRGGNFVARGDDALDNSVDLKKSPTYQISYTQDRQVKKNLFGRLRLFYQLQGVNDVLPPTGFVIRDVDFGNRYGADLQFRSSLKGSGKTLNYGLRSNNIDGARLLGGPTTLGVPNSDRVELSAYVGLDGKAGKFDFDTQLRLGITEDAPDLVLQAAVRRLF